MVDQTLQSQIESCYYFARRSAFRARTLEKLEIDPLYWELTRLNACGLLYVEFVKLLADRTSKKDLRKKGRELALKEFLASSDFPGKKENKEGIFDKHYGKLVAGILEKLNSGLKVSDMMTQLKNSLHGVFTELYDDEKDTEVRRKLVQVWVHRVWYDVFEVRKGDDDSYDFLDERYIKHAAPYRRTELSREMRAVSWRQENEATVVGTNEKVTRVAIVLSTAIQIRKVLGSDKIESSSYRRDKTGSRILADAVDAAATGVPVYIIYPDWMKECDDELQKIMGQDQKSSDGKAPILTPRGRADKGLDYFNPSNVYFLFEIHEPTKPDSRLYISRPLMSGADHRPDPYCTPTHEDEVKEFLSWLDGPNSQSAGQDSEGNSQKKLNSKKSK